MKRLVMALTLMCALSITIFAGNMPTDGKAETPPPTTTSATSSTLLVSVILTILSLK